VNPQSWREEALTKLHNRQSFDCGDNERNVYLRKYARQAHEKGGAKTFVAAPNASPTDILGYYSISVASIQFDRSPDVIRKGLGRYDVPVFRLARLVVALSEQGNGLGGMLLLAAGYRRLQVARDVGGVAILIDAKHQQAATWYRRFGAIPLYDDDLALVLPLKTIEKTHRRE